MSRFHKATVREIRRETSDTVSIVVEVDESVSKDFQFIQGQYLTFRAFIEGEEVRRTYSLCSSPIDRELRVAIKQIEGGKFSTWANTVLKQGDTLEVMPPMGNFYTALHPTNQKNYVGFAAGSGITPLLSILKTVLRVEPNSTFTLFYGNKSSASVIFKEELEALKNKYLERFSLYHILSREKTDIALFNGRITRDKCDVFFKHFVDVAEVDAYFLCGPAEMVTCVTDSLIDLGVDKKTVHHELFTSPGEITGQPIVRKPIVKEFTGSTSLVTVVLDGLSTSFELAAEAENILDAALNNGADAPYACKGAVCCTCKAKVTEGKVQMDLNYSLTEEEIEQGYVLTCQAHPITEKVVVDFDAAS